MTAPGDDERAPRGSSAEEGGDETDRTADELKSGASGAGEAPGGTDSATGQVVDPEDEPEEESEGSFPASDPPSW